MAGDRRAVLLMAYGSPRTEDEVEPYFTDIRGGRPPSPEALEELTGRYRRIGGSPLNEITERQARELGKLLDEERQGEFAVFVGMKHWHPLIADTIREIVEQGISQVIGLVLAPHFSSKSIGEYEQRIRRASMALGAEVDLQIVKSWYDHPSFVRLVGDNLKVTLRGWDPDEPATRVFFTAHSIPSRIVAGGDPYAEQLEDSARLYAAAAGFARFETAWQSASPTGEPWLGPDILEALSEFGRGGGRRALVAPVGFVSDHLEVLFDVDVECAERAQELGLELRRIPSPNYDPRFIRALAAIVMGYAS
ncbi:MAG: ferrochelatase [Actinomycetota bacterium]|nr:ferrochelatase [Actinomycetota bacterium]